MRSVRALLLAVACSSIARVQASSPREQYVQRMTDCLVPTKRPATCDEYRNRIKNIDNNYNPKILTLPQSLSGECYVYARLEVRFHTAKKTCTQAGGLLPWFVTKEEKEEVLKVMFTKADSVDIWVGYFKSVNDFSPGNLYGGWNGICPVATNGLKPIEQEHIKKVFNQLNDEGEDMSARYTGGLKDRPAWADYHFVCMTVILPLQTSNPPPPTTSPSSAAITPQPTPAPSTGPPAPSPTWSKGPPAPAPTGSKGPPAPAPTGSKGPPALALTPSKAASLATGLIIGLILLFLCLIGLSAFMFLIMKKKKQKLEQAQRDAEQQDKMKEKDELSAGATQSQSCYTEGTTATETATPDITPVMIPVHLGDTKEQCSGKKSCLCTMCRAKKEMLGEKIPEKEEEKGVVSLVSDML